MIDQASSS